MQLFGYSIISKKVHNEIISWLEKVVKENIELKLKNDLLQDELEIQSAKIKSLKVKLRYK